MKIEFITEEDIKAVLDIYAPYVKETTITFEYEVPSYEEFSERVHHYTEQFPWIVAKENNEILGYAYASTYRSRIAYQWGCELSVYLKPDAKGHHLGEHLYRVLMDLLKAQGYYMVYGVISVPNAESVGLHEKLGFELEGIQKNCGFKHGRWLDTAIMSKSLHMLDQPKEGPQSIHNLPETIKTDILNKEPR